MKTEELYELVEHIMFSDLMDVELAVKSIKNYAREMCELQKQECVTWDVNDVDEFLDNPRIAKSILNCKNVCDE